jgi:GNAT superfamily N-acetyltransferase
MLDHDTGPDPQTVDATVVARHDDGFEIDTDRARLDVAAVHDWISNDSYWAKDRPRHVMEKAIDASICFGLYAADGHQVAFARVVTDQATFAWLCDVYVAREVRGRGLGTWLAQSIAKHVLDLGVPRIVLATADAHGVYAKAGFVPFASPGRWMEIDLRTTVLPG